MIKHLKMLKCAVCFTFDLDAEYVFMGTNPEVKNMPRVRARNVPLSGF